MVEPQRVWVDLGDPRDRKREWADAGRVSLRQLRTSRLDLIRQACAESGDYVRASIAGIVDIHLISDPAGIQHVLVRNHSNYLRGEADRSPLTRALGRGLLLSEGDFHRRQRRLIQPMFSSKRIAEYSAVAAEIVERTRAEWSLCPGSVVDVHAEMMRMTMIIIGRVLFRVDLSREARSLGRVITLVNELTSEVGFTIAGRLPWFPTLGNLRLVRSARSLHRAIDRIIAERRASGLDHGDLLSLLLQAQDDEVADGGTGARMSDEQVRNEALILFAAGHETTANMLTWTWYLLARNPGAEVRLHAELDSVLGGRPPQFEDLPNLPYTDRVLRESMRLYPPAWVNARQSIDDDEICGHPLPGGSPILVFPIVVHRDARWFPDPEVFDPDRFLPEASAARPRFSYFPFGGGARQCIGQSFAEMEGRLALAHLAQHFTPRLAEDQVAEMEPMLTLRPKGGLRMRLVPRRSTT